MKTMRRGYSSRMLSASLALLLSSLVSCGSQTPAAENEGTPDAELASPTPEERETNYCIEKEVSPYHVRKDKSGNPIFKAEEKRDVCTLVGESAPPFHQRDDNPRSRTQGKYVGPQDFAGQVVVLNYWATWCAPCKEELPEFERVDQALDDVVVLALNIEGYSRAEEEFGRDVLPGLSLTFPVLSSTGKNPFSYTMIEDQGTRDEETFRHGKGEVDDFLGPMINDRIYGQTQKIPTTIIIGKDQVVREVHVGKLSADKLTAIVEKYR